jgi:hypothetical protein
VAGHVDPGRIDLLDETEQPCCFLFPQRAPEGGGAWSDKFAEVRGWVAAAGRDPASFGVDARINVASGPQEEWRAEADDWHALGATHLTLNTMGGGLDGPDAHIERLRQARDALA